MFPFNVECNTFTVKYYIQCFHSILYSMFPFIHLVFSLRNQLSECLTNTNESPVISASGPSGRGETTTTTSPNAMSDSKLGTMIEYRYYCQRCEGTFNRQATFDRHLQNCIVTSRRFVCPVCSVATFSTRANCLKHLRFKHGTDLNPHKCQHCGKTFRSDYLLLRHHEQFCQKIGVKEQNAEADRLAADKLIKGELDD